MISLDAATKYNSYPPEEELEIYEACLSQNYQMGELDPIRGNVKTKGYDPLENSKKRKFAVDQSEEDIFISQNREAYEEALEFKDYIDNFFENDKEVVCVEVWDLDSIGWNSTDEMKFSVVVYSKYDSCEFSRRKYNFYRKVFNYARKLKFAKIIGYEVVDKYNTLL